MKPITLLLFVVTLSAQSIPEIPYDSAPNLLKMPPHIYLGEAAGVATNSKGNIFVYTRTGSSNAVMGASRTFTHGGARLFEFAPNGTFLREIGQGVYGFLFAHVVRIDPQDNIWVVDEGSSMVIKFDPVGRILLTLAASRRRFAYRLPNRARVAVRVADAADFRAPASRATISTGLPTWRGMLRATSLYPTATATRAWRSSTRTGCS